MFIYKAVIYVWQVFKYLVAADNYISQLKSQYFQQFSAKLGV